ncbi:TerD family protein [Priestia koreensis]|uniref:TerD family protein n=1 Tax=Priestia koreensis TaxID=284581 RepID=UPI00203F574C|nr:Tellurium resistance [Priestia koreensis]MCM3005945.1 Tellurium resistance [Priestia koreensis]
MIQLTKKGQSINLSKDTHTSLGEISVNLNWNQKPSSGGFFKAFLGGNKSADLDLGCLYEMQDGRRGCVQALGNAFGNLQGDPYIQLDHDDRTGASTNGENLRINGDKLIDIKRILVYTFIYEGAANWNEVGGVVTLKYKNGEDIVVNMDEHRNGKIMCAIAMIENVQNQTFNVKRLVEYFDGHQQMDKAYKWGMQWTAGRK